MESGEHKVKTPSSEVSWAQIVCVESFPKKNLNETDERLSSIAGMTLVKSPPRSNLNLMSDRLSAWKCDDLDACFTYILEATKEWGGSRDLFSRFIVGVTIESLDSGALPFYLVVMRIDLSPGAVGESRKLAKELSYIRNSFRVFLERLNGFSKVEGGASPCVPAITVISAYIEQKALIRMRKIAECLSSEPRDEREREDRRAIGDTLRELEPFDLDPTKQKDMKSHVLLEPNVTLILGNADPYSVFLRSPYMVLLSSTKGLLDSEPFELPIAPYLTNSPFEQIWFLPQILIVPMGTLSWIAQCWTNAENLLHRLSRVGSDTSADSSKISSDAALLELTEIELKVSGINLALGLLEEGYGKTFEAWCANHVRGQLEIPIPSRKHWHSKRDLPEMDGGYLSALGGVLEKNVRTLSKQGNELEHQVGILSNRCYQARLGASIQATEKYTEAVRDSSAKMEAMTNAQLKSQDTLTYLTAVLIIMTAMLVIISFLSSDMGRYTLAAYVSLFILMALVLKRRLITNFLFSVVIALISFNGLEESLPDFGWLANLLISLAMGALVFIVLWKRIPSLGDMAPSAKV